jgi:glycosyltransferase involved in cell wall biosynthesis
MSAKTILIACDTFAPDHNGTAMFSKRLASALQHSGYEVHVIAPATSRLYGTFRESHDGQPIIVHRLKSLRLPFQPAQRFVNPTGLTKRIRGLLQAIKPDVVHIQSHINIGHHASVAAVGLNIPVVATSHIDLESLVNNTILSPVFVRRFLTRMLINDAARVFKSAKAITAPSRRAALQLERAVKGLTVVPVPGGVNTSLYASLKPPSLESRRLLYVGRLDREKRVFVLIEALSRVSKELNIHLRIVGGGGQAHELVRLTKELHLEQQVTFLGELNDDEVLAELEQSTALVMPSTQELQSLATLEALAAGRPVIAADAMVLPNLITSATNGYLFKPDSPKDLARTIENLFQLTQSQFDAMSIASKKSVSRFEFAKTVAVFEHLYNGEPVPVELLADAFDYESEGGAAARIRAILQLSTTRLERGTSGVIERLDGVRGAVSESFGDLRFSIERRSKRAAKKLSRSLRKALETIRKDD